MSADFDRLLRDTLHGRATTVVDAPSVPEQVADGRHRSRWVLVAATTVAVLVIGGGVAYLARDARHDTPAVGDAPPSCATTLPASWGEAIDARPLTAGGSAADPEEGGVDGSLVVDTFSPGGADDIYLSKAGRSSKLLSVPAGRTTRGPSWDGRYLVVASAPSIPADSPDTPVDDITVVDTRLHRTVHVLAKAPLPTGWVVGRANVVVRDGIVYWGATPKHNAETGIVLSYDIAHRRYQVAARLDTYPTVQPDPRGGVTWDGTLVGRRIAPPDVPAVLDGAGDIPAYVVTDNRSWAWTYRTHDRSVVSWASVDGAARRFLVDPVHDRRFPPLLTATAGPFVFFGLDGHGTDSYVLDTRTGALAPTGNAEYKSVSAGRLFERSSQDASYHEVDVAKLPELRCR